MQYKTIALELLQRHPEIHDRLRQDRVLLAALNQFASHLKASHEAWKDQLRQVRPGSNEIQLASEALEVAIKELGDGLLSMIPSDESEPLSLDQAMAFIRGRKPPE